MSGFEYRVADGRTVAEIVFAPLDKAGIMPTVVDVGARNGFLQLPSSYTKRAELVGFEPNPEEYRKLVAGTTDAAAAGVPLSSFAKETYFDCALWERDEERPFYVTVGPGASTLMGEAVPEVASRIFQCYPPGSAKAGKSFLDQHAGIREVIPMKCRRLDSLLTDDRTVDYLKIDVEGAELQVMRGAEALFAKHRVLFVYTEFVLLPYYAEHPLLGDQQSFLRDHGLRLIEIEMGHVPYTRDPTPIGPWADRRLMHAGDASFILDPDRNNLNAEERQRLAAATLAHGFHSLGVGLLREAALCSAAEIDAVERALQHVPLARLLRRTWGEVPYKLAAAARRLKAQMRSVVQR